MGFPRVIVECAFNSILGEGVSAQSGYTEITKFVDSISGTLRGRAYELDQVETGSITVALDNSDGRFTPGSPNSPYFPYVKANRRFRIRGNNLQRLNIARAGGQEDSAEGFFRGTSFVNDATDGVTNRVSGPWVAKHNPVTLGFDGALLAEPNHIEATLYAGATAGSYRVISFWCPVELGVRSTHSAYVWKVNGTEPSGTLIYLVNSYYDANGVEIEKAAGDSNIEWTQPTPGMPTLRAFADLPPGNAAYMIQSVALITTSTTTTDITYAVCGIQTEIPTGNLVPSISGYYDVEAWEMTGGGTVATGGTTWSDAFVLTTWAADSVELSTTVPHLVPGDRYTFVVEAKKSSGPDILLTGDDGLTGVTLTANNVWTTLRTSFTTPRAEQPIKLIPQGATTASDTLSLRLARCTYEDAALPLATGATDTNETDWSRPIPIFEGKVERWPIKTTAAASTISITVNDRMKDLGELTMESTLKQVIITDDPGILIPFADDPTDSKGVVSIIGDWSDASETSQLAPTASKFGAGAATFALGGLIGPTDEDAVKLTQVSSTQGYSIAIPYSYDFVATTPPVVTPPPVPKPPVVTTYKKTYYATWSRSYNGSNGTRFDDPNTLYQGASLASGDSNGNQRSLIGFNWSAINADLKGASVTGMTISLYSLHFWYYAGGTIYLGTHTYTSKPSTYNTSNGVERRWKQTKWPRNAWRTVSGGAAGGVLFQKGTAKGIVVGWGDNDHETYGYLAGATMKQRPYLTITFKK
jgi:hypothetical protein